MKNTIRVQRAIKEVTQQEVAEALGVRVQTIHSIEREKYGPSLLLAMRLAEYFGVTVNELFTLTEEDKNPGSGA